MKIITFNVNGLRAVLQKDKSGKRGGNTNVLQALLAEHDPDILCLQETKCPEDVATGLPFAFTKILASKTRKGYSGVAVLSKEPPLQVFDDFPHNEEGRVIVAEYPKFVLINAYVPNAKPDLSRLSYRVDWEQAMRAYINKCQKPVVYVGDLNVAPAEIDLHNPKANVKSHGFTVEERGAFADLLKDCKLVDTFRVLHPDERAYTWYSNFGKARENNKGWRIDHILVSKKLQKKIQAVEILGDYYGSDHVPVLARLDDGIKKK